MRSLKHLLAIAALAAAGTASTWAVQFQGTAVGSWVNVVSTDGTDIYSVANNDAGATATFNWGTPATTTFNNQFTFNGVGSDGLPNWEAIAEAPFKLGDFTYRNGSTYYSTGIDGVSLNVLLTIVDPAGLGANNYLFNYSIVNTENTTGDPVLDGDIVKILGQPSPTTFMYAGNEYTLDILGFSSDGGATIRTDFSSPEGATADAALYARITEDIHGIPEVGSTLLLLGLALLGTSAFRRFSQTR